jgi:hypothetical protein
MDKNEPAKIEISENKVGMSRRQFLKTTGTAVAIGMITGMGIFEKPLY